MHLQSQNIGIAVWIFPCSLFFLAIGKILLELTCSNYYNDLSFYYLVLYVLKVSYSQFLISFNWSKINAAKNLNFFYSHFSLTFLNDETIIALSLYRSKVIGLVQKQLDSGQFWYCNPKLSKIGQIVLVLFEIYFEHIKGHVFLKRLSFELLMLFTPW